MTIMTLNLNSFFFFFWVWFKSKQFKYDLMVKDSGLWNGPKEALGYRNRHQVNNISFHLFTIFMPLPGVLL